MKTNVPHVDTYILSKRNRQLGYGEKEEENDDVAKHKRKKTNKKSDFPRNKKSSHYVEKQANVVIGRDTCVMH